MKRILLFLALLPTISFGQKNVYVEFTSDSDTFPDCNTSFIANGIYSIAEQLLPDFDLPNTMRVEPSTLVVDSLLRFHSFGTRAAELGIIEQDAFELIPLSSEEVDSIFYASEEFQWSSNRYDPAFLVREFGIVMSEVPIIQSKPELKTDSSDIGLGSNVLISGIIDGVYIREINYSRYAQFCPTSEAESDRQKNNELRKNALQPQLDSLLRPFYFSNYEVTNRQYRQFMDWVKDSIELRIAYEHLSAQHALLLVDCTEKTRKQLDSLNRKENLEKYGLSRRNQQKISTEEWLSATKSFYYPQPERFYKRREVDSRLLRYEMSDTSIAIYPDSTGFLNIQLGWAGAELSSFSWHPAYDDYPIVNLNYQQIMAYCHWKQRQLNEKYASEGYRITVRPPSILEYEFATKTTLGPAGYLSTIDQSNDSFITHEREVDGMGQLFYSSVLYDPTQPSKKKTDHEPSLAYKQWYQANQSESTVKFLNGNVSEMVIDDVTQEKCAYYGIESTVNDAANFVLGSNYLTDVKTIGDDQYNAIFYKTIQKKSEASPFVGFRLVYLLEKIEE